MFRSHWPTRCVHPSFRCSPSWWCVRSTVVQRSGSARRCVLRWSSHFRVRWDLLYLPDPSSPCCLKEKWTWQSRCFMSVPCRSYSLRYRRWRTVCSRVSTEWKSLCGMQRFPWSSISCSCMWRSSSVWGSMPWSMPISYSRRSCVC